ncbi:DUF1941-domain-containing protein [Patellaria atrata CBS 101060]|uniref:DUF1941-domain-containing protein n=1 Tax=Patellaria atrata CBS 101060 TaxID=1346257 RepID=A0A9P4S5S8_9PEZI|nr:DUF1941-domain-containing protein [Patellaria atrata CBS 101060]
MFFNQKTSDPDTKDYSYGKPYPYMVATYLLITIRSTVPSLIENLAADTYLKTTLYLAACYDMLGAFIIYLVSNIDRIPDEGLPLKPDHILSLRKDISEVMSYTLEFIRDRWDASISGLAGLHPAARPTPENKGAVDDGSGQKRPLSLPWGNVDVSARGDPIIVAGLRTLALWLRDEDAEGLGEEVVGVMDVLMDLYKGDADADVRLISTEASVVGANDL